MKALAYFFIDANVYPPNSYMYSNGNSQNSTSPLKISHKADTAKYPVIEDVAFIRKLVRDMVTMQVARDLFSCLGR